MTAHSKDAAFQQCMATNDQGSSGTTRCFANYLQRLETEQKKLIVNIRKSLADQSPDGKNHEAAQANFSKAQIEWMRFSKSDCDVRNNLFGLGNAAVVAEVDCYVQHYEIRNKQLKALLSDYLAR